jgi:hypothetical protein
MQAKSKVAVAQQAELDAPASQHETYFSPSETL